MSEEILVTDNQAGIAPSVPAVGGLLSNVWADKEQFNQLLRSAQMLSQTSIIPDTYKGKPQDCFVALEMAARMGLPPIAVMQNMFVVKGKPAWSGQACTMLINSCGKFTDIKHIFTGTKGTEGRGCYVQAVRISDGEVICGTEVTMQMAKAEGWTSNPKWRNMPELMLAYRASSFFARVYCPEALMGVHVDDEIFDASVSARSPKTASKLTDELNAEPL